jgi:hypothetical protein
MPGGIGAEAGRGRFALGIATLEQASTGVDANVRNALVLVDESARILSTIPGISDVTAHVMAELGANMMRCVFDFHLRLLATQTLPGDAI